MLRRVATLILIGAASSLKTPIGTVSSRGTGPPVLFTSGLYNVMPSWAYSSLLKQLERNMTLFRYDSGRVLGAEDVEVISDAIGANEIGLVPMAIRQR